MIDFLEGRLVEVSVDSAVILVGGIGYRVYMSTQALSSLPKIGESATVSTYLSVREDGISIYGFSGVAERDLFLRMTAVSGIGPKVALSALSTFEPGQLASAIASGDVSEISKIPGVGKKTAQRIILELSGYVEDMGSAEKPSKSQEDPGIISALLSMGFTESECRLALSGFEGQGEAEALKYALKKLA